MHDLIQGMGWEIVRQESITYPGRRSRLRDNDEVYDVLKNNRGTHAVEAIQIDKSQIRDLSLSVDTFKKMPNLRFHKIYCPLQVELFVPSSNGEEFLRRVMGSKIKKTHLSESFLKKTEISQSIPLAELPELIYKTSILECANLNDCHSLHDLVNLKNMASDLQQVFKCKSLSAVHSCICKELESIGSEIHHLKHIDYVLIDCNSCEKEFSVSLMEILNSTVLHINNNLECSDMDALQHSDISDEILCQRSTSYLRDSKSGGQENVKPKLHILFDGLICYRRITLIGLLNLVKMMVPQTQNISVFSNLHEWKPTRDINIRQCTVAEMSEWFPRNMKQKWLSRRHLPSLEAWMPVMK